MRHHELGRRKLGKAGAHHNLVPLERGFDESFDEGSAGEFQSLDGLNALEPEMSVGRNDGKRRAAGEGRSWIISLVP